MNSKKKISMYAALWRFTYVETHGLHRRIGRQLASRIALSSLLYLFAPLVIKLAIDGVADRDLMMAATYLGLMLLTYLASEAWMFRSLAAFSVLKSDLQSRLLAKDLKLIHRTFDLGRRGRYASLAQRVERDAEKIAEVIDWLSQLVSTMSNVAFSIGACVVLSPRAFLYLVPILVGACLLSAITSGKVQARTLRSDALQDRAAKSVALLVSSLPIFATTIAGNAAVDRTMCSQEAYLVGRHEAYLAQRHRILISSAIFHTIEVGIMMIGALYAYMAKFTIGGYFSLTRSLVVVVGAARDLQDQLALGAHIYVRVRRRAAFYARARNNLSNLASSPHLPSVIGANAPSRIVVVGPNGCGKTVLLEQAVQRGRLQLTNSASRLEVAYCPSIPVFPLQTVRELIAGLRLDPSFQGEDRLFPMLASFGIEKRIDEVPLTWSDGERHRLGIAVCLSLRADLYVLDEPMTSIDSSSHKHVYAAIEGAVHEGRVVVSSHVSTEFFSSIGGWNMISVELGAPTHFETAPDPVVNNESTPASNVAIARHA